MEENLSCQDEKLVLNILALIQTIFIITSYDLNRSNKSTNNLGQVLSYWVDKTCL